MSKWIYKLEYRFRRFGVDNLMIYITGTMLAVYLAANLLQGAMPQPLLSLLSFNRALALRGQVWRALTFMFIPSGSNIIWVLFELYMYYLFGTSLENTWGRTRFTMFCLFGYIGTLIAAFISGFGFNTPFYLSILMAFAALSPDFEILIFFVLPVKIKYIALIEAAIYVFLLLFGGWHVRLAILAAFANLFLFFGDNFINWLKDWKRYGRKRMNFRRNQRTYRDYWR
jgi:hypothetical protein